MSQKTKKEKINRLISIQKKALKNRRRFKAFTSSQNRFVRRRYPKSKRPRSEGHSPYFGQSSIKRIEISVPDKFSINQDVESVLSFIYKSKKTVESRHYNLFVIDFARVTRIDDGAMTILLSLLYDMSYKRIRSGFSNLPVNEDAKSFIQQSGFIRYFDGPLTKVKNEGLNVTLRKGKSTILQKDSATMIHQSMKTVWGEDIRNQKLQGMLIELMTNSVNHAYLNNEKEKTWYISTNHYQKENKVEFCFVDNGDGIINTINFKFKDRYFTSHEELLQRAFDGEFRSRTKLANRGRGLIVVKTSHKNMTIRGLKVITNSVFLDFDSGAAIKLKTPFSGTFYSWIIDKSCK